MPIGRLSVRSRPGNRLHHLYRNNGDVWWVHYTLNWDGRTRRIRRSLATKCVEEAIRLRDELFARIERDGEPVPDRRKSRGVMLPSQGPTLPCLLRRMPAFLPGVQW